MLILSWVVFLVFSLLGDKFSTYWFYILSFIGIIRIIIFIYGRIQKTNRVLLKKLYNKKTYKNLFETITEDNINSISHAKKIKAKLTFVVKAKENCIIKYFKNPIIQYDFAKLSDLKTQSSLPYESARLPTPDEEYINKDIIFEQNHDMYKIGKQYDISDEEIFSFIVLKNQYKFLKENFSDNIPDTKFAVIQTSNFSLPKFAIIQKRILGVTLWDLYYHMDAEFEKKKEMLAKQMESFLNCDHIDFNIENFMVTNENLFYIENKPAYFATKRSVDLNKDNIIKALDLQEKQTASGTKLKQKGGAKAKTASK
jgi:hypothetical protein